MTVGTSAKQAQPSKRGFSSFQRSDKKVSRDGEGRWMEGASKKLYISEVNTPGASSHGTVTPSSPQNHR
jgi:hypothetical protein